MALTDRGRVFGARAQAAPIAWLTRHVFDRDRVCRLRLVKQHPALLRYARGHLGVAVDRDDVVAVLHDDATFAAGYTARLPGPFVLGLEGERHATLRRQLEAAVPDADAERIAADTTARAEQIVDAAGGSLDVGAALVRPVLDATVTDYLGVSGADAGTRWLWGRDIFEHIFLNVADAPAVRANADVATARLTELIRASFGTAGPDTVLGRLVAANELSADEICVNIVGLAVGWWWHAARTALIAVDEILNDDDLIVGAREAAESGAEPLRQFLWEVLRFRPVQLGVIRTCTRDAVVAGRQVRRAATVVAGTHAAMRDGVPDPDEFRPGRPDDAYRIFGGGSHACLGETIMRAQLSALLRPLLVRPGLHRTGPLRWDGPRPDGVEVSW